jgi:16S rRNA (uracil1498-N3)-methyltransferase
MNAHRFLFYDPAASGESLKVTLLDEEHHHFIRVLRHKEGQRFYVTNGQGLIAECEALEVTKDHTRAEMKDIVSDIPPVAQFVLALGVIKKDKFEQAFEQCVELGITGCIPFVSSNTQVKHGYNKQFLARLDKIALTAIKQSFRAWRPGVVEPVSFDKLVAIAGRTRRVFVGEEGAPPVEARDPMENTMVIVGPEAGLSHAELRALKGEGGVPAAVTKGRLRSETAAVAMIAEVAGGN